jgi:hypothetical protein
LTLLSYTDGGTPSNAHSNSEKAANAVVKYFELGLSESQIRSDLLKEKSFEFIKTKTFALVRQAYRDRFGKDAPFAILPDIQLNSVKIDRQMTTAEFANSVNLRFQRCLARAKAQGSS